MQRSLEFATDNRLPEIHGRLSALYPEPAGGPTDPLRQLLYVVICEGLQPAAGLAVFNRIIAHFPTWPDLKNAAADQLEDILVGVPRAAAKVTTIPALLSAVEADIGELSLDHLNRLSTDAAQRWLERLPGVSGAMAAAVLAFSTLKRPVVAIDRDSARPVRRLGLSPDGAPISALPRHVVGRSPSNWGAEAFSQLSEGLRRLGRSTCREDRPACGDCPLSDLCPTAGHRSAQIVRFTPRRNAARSVA